MPVSGRGLGSVSDQRHRRQAAAIRNGARASTKGAARRKAVPTPDFMKPYNRNVVTYYTRGNGPVTANRQLDYVWCSRGFHEQFEVCAMNGVEEWGSSDHCRIRITHA